jgi:hypothetical protein
MKVTKSEPRITLTVVGEQQREFEEPRVLDQRGFPWEVVSYAETEVTLRPLRADMQWDVSEVWPYSARIAVAQRNRIFDYMAQIEACDFEIKTVFACAEDAIEPNEALRRKNDEVKAGTILITAYGDRCPFARLRSPPAGPTGRSPRPRAAASTSSPQGATGAMLSVSPRTLLLRRRPRTLPKSLSRMSTTFWTSRPGAFASISSGARPWPSLGARLTLVGSAQ